MVDGGATLSYGIEPWTLMVSSRLVSSPLLFPSLWKTRPSSFASCVGQFVLLASLRSQVNPDNKITFPNVSPER